MAVSADPDFFGLVHARPEAGLTFPDLIFVASGTAVGPAVAGLEIAGAVFDSDDMVDQIEWVR